MGRNNRSSRGGMLAGSLQRRISAVAAAVFVVVTLSIPAFALVTGDNANIGILNAYGQRYAGFWLTGASDYSILTSSLHTFVNAPSVVGTIFFRGGNGGPGPDNDGWTSRMYLTPTALNVNVPVNVTLGNRFSATALYGYSKTGNGVFGDSNAAAGVYGKSLSAKGVHGVSSSSTGVMGSSDSSAGVEGESNDWYGVSGRSSSSYGVYGYSLNTTSYAVYSDGNLYVAGAASKPGGGPFSAPSDARIKKDVVELTQGLEELDQVRPVRFKYNGLGGTREDGKEYVGVIAQDLERTLPWMVGRQPRKLRPTDARPTDLAEVDPAAFTYLLINAVKELAAENRGLKELVCPEHPGASVCSTSPTRRGRAVVSRR
jgi:Chaperone of endosialidase